MFTFTTIAPRFLLAAAAVGTICGGSAFAESGEDGSKGVYSSRGGSPWATYYRYLEENPEIYAEADRTFPHGQTGYGEHGETQKNVPGPRIPGKVWPIVTQPHVPEGPEKMMNWAKTMDRITGYSKEPIGSVNLSPAFAALSMGVAGQMLADELQSPQATMPRAREEQNQQIQQSADNTAAMERQQAGCAIDFVASYLYNFTVEDGNKWNRVRNSLFLPMALLLLLPGAVLAQVKSIASQGFAVLGEINPFDGLMRSVIAIFLIPGTYLVVNYGIDLANSITKTVSDQYQKTFGTNMYEDAMCGHIRAFPFREPIENKNFVPNAEAKMGRLSPNNTPFAELEGKMLNVKLTDPCAKLNIVPSDRANEQVKYSVNAQRNAYNTANAALAMAWNILCAFQMAYLYYLWFVGPVVAALWVYPMKQLRDAFPSWCEGVLTLCFWSLFWSTVVLLMACFRGVDETGTIVMTALNFLATACVKFAFDFAGLVKDAGREAGRMAEKMAQSGAGHGGGAGAKGASGGQGVGSHNGGAPAHGAPGANGNGAGGGVPGADGTIASNGGGDFGFLEPGAGAGDGAAAPFKGINAGASEINGQVSMHGFPQPPMAGHHHNALGVIGTALGGAALLGAAAALAQPHFMHPQHPAGAGGTAAPGGADGGTTGTAKVGEGAFTGVDPAKNISMMEGDTHEGDMYEHNWGDIAAGMTEAAGDAGGTSGTLDPNGPPLNSLPPNPALSLTPPGIGLPPGSAVDGNAPAIAGIIPGSLPDVTSPNAIVPGAAGPTGGVLTASGQDAPNLHLNPLHVNGGSMHVGGNTHVAGDHSHHAGDNHIHGTQPPGVHHNEHNQQPNLFRDASMVAQGNGNYTDYSQVANYQQLQQLQQQQQWQTSAQQLQQDAVAQQQQWQQQQLQAAVQQQQDAVTQQQQSQATYADYVLSQQSSSMAANTSAVYSYDTSSYENSSGFSTYDASAASFAALSDSIISNTESSSSVDYSSSTYDTSYGSTYDTTYGNTFGTTYGASYANNSIANVDNSSISSIDNTLPPATAIGNSAPGAVVPAAPTTESITTLPPAALGASSTNISIEPVGAAPPAVAPSASYHSPPAPSYSSPSASSVQQPAPLPMEASAAFAQSMAVQNAQQQLRNQLATHQEGLKQANIQQPKQAPTARSSSDPTGLPKAPGGKPSQLGAALGKASSAKPTGPVPPAPRNPNTQPKGMPVVKPASSKGSLQDAVTHANTRNRYVKSSGLTPEEIADLEAKARESGDWLPSE